MQNGRTRPVLRLDLAAKGPSAGAGRSPEAWFWAQIPSTGRFGACGGSAFQLPAVFGLYFDRVRKLPLGNHHDSIAGENALTSGMTDKSAL